MGPKRKFGPPVGSDASAAKKHKNAKDNEWSLVQQPVKDLRVMRVEDGEACQRVDLWELKSDGLTLHVVTT